MLSRISFHVLYGRWLTLVPTLSLRRPFKTPCRHCFPRFTQKFARSSVPVLDHRVLVEILHRTLFILGLNALVSKSPVHLRRQQLPWTRRIKSLTWRRSLMSWVVRMHSRLDWRCTSLKVMHLLSGRPISKPKTDTETSTEFMQRFIRLAGFLGAAAGTAEAQAKNF
nr:zinc finger, CCHC-type, retrotransposon Gag domain protein [Tanacetum cinerariifolium]